MRESSWQSFHEKTKDLPPSLTATEGIKHVLHKDKALDLGCGSFRDTKYLLDEGFEVTAVDKDPGIEQHALKVDNPKLHIEIVSFSSFGFDLEAYDFINSNNSLPFLQPIEFYKVIDKIKNSLKQGGIFSGSFFGDRDEWNSNSQMVFLTKSEIKHIFHDMEIISITEIEEDSETVSGTLKHWHRYIVVAKKI